MQPTYQTLNCCDCHAGLVDLEDELVCPKCGVVIDKEILEMIRKSGEKRPQPQ